MEQTNISLDKGIHRSPSLGPEGELSECVNLIPQNGELVNIQAPVETGDELRSGAVFLAKKKFGGSEYLIYIADSGLSLYVKKTGAQSDTRLAQTTAGDSFMGVSSTGNTLIVYKSTGASYYLYRNGEFSSLGGAFPKLLINFGLRGQLVNANSLTAIDSDDYFDAIYGLAAGGENGGMSCLNFGLVPLPMISGAHPTVKYVLTTGAIEYISGTGYYEGVRTSTATLKTNVNAKTNNDHYETWSGVRKTISDAVLARVNSFMAKAANLNFFTSPFLVTFGLRLYDGTILHGEPIVLMVPDTHTMPHCVLHGIATDSNYYSTWYESPDGHSRVMVGDPELTGLLLSVKGVIAQLDYYVLNNGVLEGWEDIIKSVDIFVSQPLSRYKADGEIETMHDREFDSARQGYFGYYGESNIREEGASVGEYSRHEVLLGRTSGTDAIVEFELPSIPERDYISKVKDCGELFLLAQIPITEILESSGRKVLELSDGVLSGLTAREALIVSHLPYNSIVPNEPAFEYNNRLHIANYKLALSSASLPDSSFFCACTYDDELFNYYTKDLVRRHYKGQEDRYTYTAYEGLVEMNDQGGFYVYIPDEYATEITRYYHSTFEGLQKLHKKSYLLDRHTMLPGCVYFNGFSNAGDEESDYTYTDTIPDNSTAADMIAIRNRIIVFEEGNPFVFKNSAIITLPNDIYKLTTSAKALSQGQFGEFPLYAFCMDGIWALSVSDTGTYSAKQPISRDVLSNPNGVCQIDNAVVFVTNQGLKLISGSEVVLLSEAVEGYNIDETFMSDDTTAPLSSLPMYKFIEKCIASGVSYNEFELTSAPDTDHFVQQVQSAKIVYDYAHNLLHVFHDFSSGIDYDDKMNRHYVYSFDTHEWSTQLLPHPLVTAVPGYPLSTMQFGNKLYQYEKAPQTETVTVNNVSVTRPILRAGYALTRPLSLGDPLARKALYDLRVVGQRTDSRTLRRVAVFVSNDNIHWTRLTSLKALSAKYYRFLIMTSMTDLDTLSGLALQHDTRYNHKMRGH